MSNNSTRRKQDIERPRVNLRIGRLKMSLPLVHVRAYLISINLMVFLSALSTFSAGRDASIFHNEDLCVEREEYIKQLENFTNEKVANAVNNYIENILNVTSGLLFLHWIVYGVAISSRFDGTFEKCGIATWTVHTLVTVAWELGLAVVLLRLEEVIPTQHPMSRLYSKWTTTLFILLVSIVPVQLMTVLFPFFCFEDDPVYVEEGKIWHTAAATKMEWNTNKSHVPNLYHSLMPKSHVPSLHHTQMPKSHVPNFHQTQMPKSHVPSFHHTQMSKSHVPSFHHTQVSKSHVPSFHHTQMPKSHFPNLHHTQMPKSHVPSFHHTQMPKLHVPSLHHIQIPKLRVPSLYHTEMPEQILKKFKHSPRNRLPRDEEKGQVDEFTKRDDLSCLEADYIDMGRTPPPSYHSQDYINSL